MNKWINTQTPWLCFTDPWDSQTPLLLPLSSTWRNGRQVILSSKQKSRTNNGFQDIHRTDIYLHSIGLKLMSWTHEYEYKSKYYSVWLFLSVPCSVPESSWLWYQPSSSWGASANGCHLSYWQRLWEISSFIVLSCMRPYIILHSVAEACWHKAAMPEAMASGCLRCKYQITMHHRKPELLVLQLLS